MMKIKMGNMLVRTRALSVLSSRTSSSVSHPMGRLVVIGTGWGAFALLRSIDTSKYEVIVVSPRNHFVFTPLLASASVGTLEFRCITEPVRNINKGIKYHQAECTSIDFDKKVISLTPTMDYYKQDLSINYDRLVIACGSITNTFGIKGVEKNAMFLKGVPDARKIREKIIERFEYASEPGTSTEEIERALHFVVVGAGPTGVEVSGELYDFVKTDVARLYPSLKDHVRITLVEASNRILSSFDSTLSDFASKRFARQGIKIEKGIPVVEVDEKKLVLKDGREIPYGILIWSTGVDQTALVKGLKLDKDKGSRVITDGLLRVKKDGKVLDEVFALGDCAIIENSPLPATAQVANQKGVYLRKVLNQISKGKDINESDEFSYKHFGALAYIGGWKALYDSSVKISGWSAWIMWRSAYLSMTVSTKNKIIIPMYWFLTWVFGRDISKF